MVRCGRGAAMITPTQDVLFIAFRAFILSLLPGVSVIQGLGNGSPMPAGEFICITPGAQRRLSTNHTIDDSPGLARAVLQPTEYTIQVDCYGPNASDYATTLSAMWRDPYGCDAMAPDAAPFYSTDPTQAPLINGEENYEQRWTFSALLQFNPVVSVPQQYADSLVLDLVSVDAEFPPAP